MINVESVSKKFIINKAKKGFLNFVTNLHEEKQDLFALKNISLNLQEDKIFGVVGNNGSGKSTLLKIIAGILKPTEGNVFVKGNVVYLSGFYSGVNKNLSMRDNIFIIGILNCLSLKEIKKRVDDILLFSELKDFVDVPLYKFSNGMMTRAVFSITIFTLPKSPDILILDEAIGAGLDEYFKDKVSKKIQEYIDSSKMVLIASHNYNFLLKQCSKIIWLEKGELKMFGNAQEVVNEYKKG